MKAADCDNPGRIDLRDGRWYLARRIKGRTKLLVDNPRDGFATAEEATHRLARLRLHGADTQGLVAVLHEEHPKPPKQKKGRGSSNYDR